MKSKAKLSLTSDKEGRVSSAKPRAILNINPSNERIVYSSYISWAYCKCTFWPSAPLGEDKSLLLFLKEILLNFNVFVFTCRTVWIKCCLLPTHVQMRSCKSSSVLRKGILIWISNHMGKSHTGSNVASSSTVCSLLSQIHSNSQQWLTRSVLCTLTPGRVARTAHLVVLPKPGSLFFA